LNTAGVSFAAVRHFADYVHFNLLRGSVGRWHRQRDRLVQGSLRRKTREGL
jgi:hypothetical protein